MTRLTKALVFASPPVIRTVILAVAMVAVAFPASAQTLGRATDVDISIWRIVAALLLCIVVAIVGAFALRGRLGYTQLVPLLVQRKRRLQLVETLRLNPHATLSIVDCDGKELLVLSSEHAATVVDRLPDGHPHRLDAS